MSEEKKVKALHDEELKQVSGGATESVYGSEAPELVVNGFYHSDAVVYLNVYYVFKYVGMEGNEYKFVEYTCVGGNINSRDYLTKEIISFHSTTRPEWLPMEY